MCGVHAFLQLGPGSLLATVPAAILDKGKSVAFYYRDLDENGPTLEEPSTESNLLRTLPSGL